HAQSEDSNKLFQELLEDLQIINKELAEYINSPSWDHPTFFNDNEDHSVQYKEYLENPSNEITVSNSNQEKEKQPQDSDIRQLIREECCIEVCRKQKQNMENTMLELVEVCRQKKLYYMHDNVDDLIESALYFKLISINMESQRLDKTKQEVKNIVEQPTKRETRIANSLQNFRVVHKKSSTYLNNTSQISLVHAIAPVLPTEEPEYSLSMGYEHLSTILKTESDEFTESNAKNLLPIPSEYEVTSDDESDDDESLSEEDVPIEEFKVYSNPLFDDEEINSDEIDPCYFNAESDFVESLSNCDTLIDSSSKFDYLEEYSGAFMPTSISDEERSGSLPSNTIANPKGELKAITTRSGIVLDGPSVPIPPPFINPEEDERVEETLTDQDLAEYTIKKMLKALLSIKEKLQELANTPLNENCSAVILKKLPEKLGEPRKFLISCGFNELKCKALADLGASINLMPLYVWKKLGLPELISTRMTLELANRAICTSAGIARDVFVSVGKFTFPADFVIVDYESDPRAPFILGRPFLRTARALFDVHGEEMILRDGDERLTLNMRYDTSSYFNQPQKESINLINVFNDLNKDFLKDLFLTNHQSGNPTFSSHPILTSSEVKDDIFDAEGGNVLLEKLLDLDSTKDLNPPHYFDIESDLKEIEYLLHHDPIKDIDSILKNSIDQRREIKESKLLVDELDLPCDFLLPFEYDSFISEDFSKVDALPSTNNEDKENFDPPLYELSFFKEVPRRSKQPFILEESPIDTMADQRTMAELLRAPTEGYVEEIVVPSILAEQFELKHSLINMMTSDQFFGLEKENPHDHIPDQDSLNAAAGGNLLERRTQYVLTIIENKSKVCNSRNKVVVSQVKSCDANSNSSSEIAKLTHGVNQQTSVVTTAMTAILKQFQATPPPASVKVIEEICVTCGGAH
nr:reverse transcriptase domain-containing protein [Tanacetum cinerariifolium]